MLVQPVKRRFSVEEYHRMGEAGIFHREEFVGPGHVLLAQAGIPEVWIVDVEHARIEVHRDPVGESYRTVDVVPRTGRLSPAALSDA
jgi:hypothetical protein